MGDLPFPTLLVESHMGAAAVCCITWMHGGDHDCNVQEAPLTGSDVVRLAWTSNVSFFTVFNIWK